MRKVDLPPPETPVTQVKVPSGISAVDVLQIVALGAADGDACALLGLAAVSGARGSAEAGQVLAGQAVGLCMIFSGVPFGDDLAAMDAGAGAHVDHIVGRQDRLLVVLDHDHRVAEIAQALEGFQQPRVVALMQADRGFVQHVEHAGQARADLRGQAGCAGSRRRTTCRGPRQGQIIEADIVEEAQRSLISFRMRCGDLVLLLGEVRRAASKPGRHPRIDISATWPICLLGDLDRKRLRF